MISILCSDTSHRVTLPAMLLYPAHDGFARMEKRVKWVLVRAIGKQLKYKMRIWKSAASFKRRKWKKALSSDLSWLKPRYMLEVEPEALLHLSFLGYILLPITVGPKHPAYKVNSNCLSAKQQYFQKRIPFPVVPVGETHGNKFSCGLSLGFC